MDRNTTHGGSSDDYTQEDEAKMDRAAQAGMEGAFGANPQPEEVEREMRQDAEDAFSQMDQGGAETGYGSGGQQGGS